MRDFWIVLIVTVGSSEFGGHSALIEQPLSYNVTEGSSVIFNCSTNEPDPIDWNFIAPGSSEPATIFSGAMILNRYKGRFSVVGDVSKGQYYLTINNAISEDTGTYVCIDLGGMGPDRGFAMLTVTINPVNDETSVTNSSEDIHRNNTSAVDDEIEILYLSTHKPSKQDSDTFAVESTTMWALVVCAAVALCLLTISLIVFIVMYVRRKRGTTHEFSRYVLHNASIRSRETVDLARTDTDDENV